MILFLISSAFALNFNIPGHTETCIGIEVDKNQEFWGGYVISGDGDKNVITTILDPNKIIEYISAEKSREGTFKINKPSVGIHKICFKSLDAFLKTVSFDINTGDIMPEKLASGENIEPIQMNLRRVSRQLEGVTRNLHFYQRREKVHRDLSEKTCDRILWAAGFKFITIFLLFFLQIWGLTKLLNSKQGVKV